MGAATARARAEAAAWTEDARAVLGEWLARNPGFRRFADELLSEAYLALARAAAGWREEKGAFGALAGRAVRNAVRGWARKACRRHRLAPTVSLDDAGWDAAERRCHRRHPAAEENPPGMVAAVEEAMAARGGTRAEGFGAFVDETERRLERPKDKEALRALREGRGLRQVMRGGGPSQERCRQRILAAAGSVLEEGLAALSRKAG